MHEFARDRSRPGAWRVGRARKPLQNRNKLKSFFIDNKNIILAIFATFILLFLTPDHSKVNATSINYGISQKPITDISQLMPVLCQNQSVICEGSFCIPGVKRCVCDLRQPVAFGRFCLRQLDIETKCFASSQCNHTVKNAICVDTTSQIELDYDSSRFKLDQWQHLNELRQLSQSAQSKDSTNRQTMTSPTVTNQKPPIYMAIERANRNNIDEGLVFEARDDVIMTNMRNSPYEITTPELMQQNHTRRRQNNGQLPLNLSSIDGTLQPSSEVPSGDSSQAERDQNTSTPSIRDLLSITQADFPTSTTTVSTTASTTTEATTTTTEPSTSTTNQEATTGFSELIKKKMVVKSPSWPPGVCSCPQGFMFDAMLRKCLGLSLSDAHCQSDNDCKQIKLTHCSAETKKCECDEPFVWNQTELLCQRPIKGAKVETYPQEETTQLVITVGYPFTPVTRESTPTNKEQSFMENLVPSLLASRMVPDHTVLLLIFVIVIIVATLIILRLTVKCFSSSNSTLISPKSSKKGHNKQIGRAHV